MRIIFRVENRLLLESSNERVSSDEEPISEGSPEGSSVHRVTSLTERGTDNE